MYCYHERRTVTKTVTMAGVDKEKLHIRLHVYDEEVEVTIDREEEIYYRAAAKLITDRYNRYAQA